MHCIASWIFGSPKTCLACPTRVFAKRNNGLCNVPVVVVLLFPLDTHGHNSGSDEITELVEPMRRHVLLCTEIFLPKPFLPQDTSRSCHLNNARSDISSKDSRSSPQFTINTQINSAFHTQSQSIHPQSSNSDVIIIVRRNQEPHSPKNAEPKAARAS